MIYTFYSFKGGVGRSMALANVAERMYRDGLRVLVVDFDLEAPGLERYFADVLPKPLSFGALQEKRGVLDLLVSYKELRSLAGRRRLPTMDARTSFEEQIDQITVEPLGNFVVSIYAESSGSGSLSLVTAGSRSQGSNEYSRTLLSFNWGEFYSECGGEVFFEWFRRETEKISDVVLIDSRTGMTEMGGVCTHQLADAVVSFVAANQQNQQGVIRMASSLADPDLVKRGRRGRPLYQLFVPSRLELSEGDRATEFQARFYDALREVFPNGLPGQESVELARALPYKDIFLPYVTYFAFDEKVAVRHPEHPFAPYLTNPIGTLTTSMARLADSDSTLYLKYHSTSEKLAKVLEDFWRDSSPAVQADLRNLAGRLVRVPLPNENAPDTAASMPKSDLDDASARVVETLLLKTVLKMDRDVETGKELVSFSDPNIINVWSRLRRWIDEDRPFLAWRHRLSVSLNEWESHDNDSNDLLSGSALIEAERWLRENSQGLSQRESTFIERSVRHLDRAATEGLTNAQGVIETLPPAGVDAVRRIVLRLVRVSPPERGDHHSRRRASVNEFNLEDSSTIEELQRAGVLILATANKLGEPDGLELADESLVQRWTWLREQINANRHFLTWRQGFWQRQGDWTLWEKADGFLLRGPDLVQAKAFLGAYPNDFNVQEREFLTSSARGEVDRMREAAAAAASGRRRKVFVALVVAAISTLGGWWAWNLPWSLPTIRSIDKPKFKASEKTVLQIEGNNFADGCVVQIESQSFPTKLISPTTIEVEVSPNTLKPGLHDLIVWNKSRAGGASASARITVEP